MADFSDGGGLLVRTITSIETVKKHYFKSLLVLCFWIKAFLLCHLGNKGSCLHQSSF